MGRKKRLKVERKAVAENQSQILTMVTISETEMEKEKTYTALQKLKSVSNDLFEECQRVFANTSFCTAELENIVGCFDRYEKEISTIPDEYRTHPCVIKFQNCIRALCNVVAKKLNNTTRDVETQTNFQSPRITWRQRYWMPYLNK
ncbi:Coiled-coil domain-containing protein [Caenorhabditis elegans]|uniref:Coiled-coil domain-containing protein n=1 Tax=Caenorhabditis elegans TaxID=6239 RepID=Q18052_CAEEL|nr:Coiled-coil domain-containing protein [Caenorhabditis elegans]CCD64840.1 Coiled-coil domain-containing protein [Caenorhabditis elegans]|eukprot:NP_495061.2 Uncharacterized protein CELE_C17C3.9 [Caenorhabditis elegans]